MLLVEGGRDEQEHERHEKTAALVSTVVCGISQNPESRTRTGEKRSNISAQSRYTLQGNVHGAHGKDACAFVEKPCVCVPCVDCSLGVVWYRLGVEMGDHAVVCSASDTAHETTDHVHNEPTCDDPGAKAISGESLDRLPGETPLSARQAWVGRDFRHHGFEAPAD